MATVDPDGMRDGERLVFVKQAVAAMSSDVEFAALEGYSYDSVGRVFELGEIGGVIKVLLHERGIKYVVVPPVLLKKFATGTSYASKEDMIAACKERGVHVPDDDDNQADAFFLAHVARACARDVATCRREMDVVRYLKNPAPKKPRRRVRRLVKAAL